LELKSGQGGNFHPDYSLALDLYFRHNPSHISSTHPEVIKLSQTLNSLPIHQNRPDAVRFRNLNGVYMKLCNFLRYDPNYHGVGLQRGGRLEQEIWNEFAHNAVYLRQVAHRIIDGMRLEDSQTPAGNEDEETEFPEGKVLYRQHKSRERNRGLISKAKQIAQQNGNLKCSVCNFDFYERYGDLGKGYIECHHTIPVSEYTQNAKTKVSDLSLVCSNCHRMLHRRRPWLTISELSSLILP